MGTSGPNASGAVSGCATVSAPKCGLWVAHQSHSVMTMTDAGSCWPFAEVAATSSADLTQAIPVAVHTSTHPLLPTWWAATACDSTGISAPNSTAKAASQAVKRCEQRRVDIPTSLAATRLAKAYHFCQPFKAP